jgi:hypothetical protein
VLDAAMAGDAGAHVADRAQTQYDERATGGRVGVRDALPRRREDVGQVDEPVVGRTFRNLDRQRVAKRDAQVLGLRAGHLAVELGVAEERGPAALFVNLGGLALAVQARRAHRAGAAGDVERHHYPVADLEFGDRGPDLGHHPHGLVAEDVAGVEERAEDLVQVQVGATQPARGDLDDHVGGILDRGIGNGVDADVTSALPGECTHA